MKERLTILSECDTRIIKIDPDNIDVEALKECTEVLKNGGLVCFPTETVDGLGASAFNEKAVENIFKAKGRPNDNPLIVHISDYEMLPLVTCCTGEQTERLMKLGNEYWPGPLTMIADRDSAVPETVSFGLKTVGIRMPEHPVARRLIELAGVPVAAPSANLSGKPSPSQARHVIEDLKGRVDVIIDGGDCRVGVESTVLDITSEEPMILRPGAVTLEDVKKVLGAGGQCDWRCGVKEGETPRSPGMKYTHYSPEAEVIMYEGDNELVKRNIKIAAMSCLLKGEKVGVMTVDENAAFYDMMPNVLSLGSREDSLSQASNLFRLLREFDERGVAKVFAEALPTGGVGDAVMNRLFRACGGNIVKCDG